MESVDWNRLLQVFEPIIASLFLFDIRFGARL